MYQRKPDLFFLSVMIIMLLAGCAQQKPAMTGAMRARPMPFTVVSTMDTQADVTSAASFGWNPRMREILTDPHEGDIPDREALEKAITNAMTSKGYEYTWRARQGDLQVGYVVILDGALSDKELNSRYGIQPSLNLQAPDSLRYEKGTLVIDITDRKSGRSVWRGALQGFADLHLSKEDRQERLNDMVMFMLGRFPARTGVAQ
jgi:Domain of unknown function (DUF4136)